MTQEHEEESLLSALLDGELEGPERVRLQKHLSSCASCSLELESLRKVKTILAKAPQKSMPAEWTCDFPLAFPALKNAQKSPSRASIFSQNWLIPALVAAAVSFAVSFWVFQNRSLFPLRQSLSLNANIQTPTPTNASSALSPIISNNLNQPQDRTP